MIKKAVIPAAGFGTRFLPATKSQPKEMLTVVDKPIIQYGVEEAVQSGIEQIGVITSRGKATMADHFDRSPELEQFLEDKGKLDFAKLVTALVKNTTEVIEDSAKRLKLEFPIIRTFAKLSLQPSLLETAVAVAQQVALVHWSYTYCPICGDLPAIAALVDEEGSRQAVCSFCGHFWRLPRVGCPFCNNEKHEKLRYFYGEGEELCRVHVCDECRGYFKVVDIREGGDAIAIAVDDIATGHLDLLAEEEGYHRKAPRLLGI